MAHVFLSFKPPSGSSLSSKSSAGQLAHTGAASPGRPGHFFYSGDPPLAPLFYPAPQSKENNKTTHTHTNKQTTPQNLSNYMLHFALLLHVCSLPQALSLLLRMSQKVGSCRLHWLTVCLNTTALALVSKVTTDFNVVAELRS